MIELKNLSRKYGRRLAVDNLNFSAREGKIYGLLGPNGAGKSTTMNMIAGCLAPTSGVVTVNGYDVTREPGKARQCIGYLPEVPPLYPEMTVEEYLSFAVELKRVPKKERKEELWEVMRRTGTETVRKRLIRNLSKGYRQRTGLAQALLGHPAVLILDEPTAGLDPQQILEIRELIRELKDEHTVILSSHILPEVGAVCDEILILSKGRLVADDTPEGLSARLCAKRQMTALIKGDGAKVRAALCEISGVVDCTVQKEEDRVCRCLITMEKGRDIREEMFYLLAGHKMPLLLLQENEKSLEDIFLRLTGGQKEKMMEKQEEGHNESGL